MRASKLLFFFLLLTLQVAVGQTVTEIYGKVTDASTKEPISYVNVRIYGGVPRITMTDPKGEFVLRTNEKIDSVVFSSIGYHPRSVHIKRGGVQELNIAMGSDELKLTEITVKAGKRHKRVIDTAANYVFYQVLKHKDENRANGRSTYKYENYDRLQISLLNPSEKFQNFFLWKAFHFAFENKDTTDEGSMYIPGVIKETYSDIYFRSHPINQKKEFVKAEQMTGIDNPSVFNLIRTEFKETDPYDNLYYFARTYFSAPFAPIGLGIYYFYLTDTARMDGRVSYKLHFVGKTKEDLALKGYAWIDSATWAIKYIQFRPNEKANLNFINEYDAKIDFTLVDGKYWMKNREQMQSIGSLFKKKNKLGILVQKLVEKKNFEINVALPDSFFKKPEEIILLDSARQKGRAYWDSVRFERLSPTQKRVFEISDTIKEVPAWKTLQWLGVFFTSAFADVGPISIGRVLNFGSRNAIEGWRARFGFETCSRFGKRGTPGNNFLRTFYFTGYGAYGFSDKDWKYMALTRIALPRKNDHWQTLEAFYKYDIKVAGQDESQTLLTFDNIVTLIAGKTLNKAMKVREFNVNYEKDWTRDFSTIETFSEQTFYNVPGVSNFAHKVNDVMVPVDKFNVTQFIFNTRYSRKSLYTAGVFYRYFATTKTPVVMLRYIAGVAEIQQDHMNFHNLQFTLSQRLFSAIGYTNYSFKAAKIFGRAPYTTCYLTQGNLGVLLDKFNYNLLRDFEFVSDQYAQLWIEHHFNGFFFNKIPGFNKLKLREVLVFKSLIGSFSKKNADVLSLPTDLKAPGPMPYIELGFGIENIAYLFRVDFLWRATYRNTGGQNWGVKFILKPNF